MFRPDLLAGKVVIITGGGTGLGKSMALRLGELGAKLALTSRSLDHLEPVAEAIRAKGGSALAIPCDVRDADAVEAMVQRVAAELGGVDALINNAAGNFLALTETLSARAFSTVVDIVLRGTFHCTLSAGKQMIAQHAKTGRGGNILSIVATYTETGSAFVVPSAAAKSGVLAIMRSLAVEWACHKIRCNAIAPGPFPTEGAWARLVPPGMEDAMGSMAKAHIPAGRFGEHHELANLVAYLLADESAYITGECVVIDGGESLMSGDFNRMIAVDRGSLGQMFSAMRPKK